MAYPCVECGVEGGLVAQWICPRCLSRAKSVGKAEEPEPAWIRDITAADVILKIDTPEKVAAVCAGEKIYCGYCGAAVDLWPQNVAAKHVVETHADEITVQWLDERKAAMAGPELSGNAQVWLQLHLTSRVSMRRRAWQLGYAVTVMLPRPSGKIRLA